MGRGNPTRDCGPIQGEITILLVTACYQSAISSSTMNLPAFYLTLLFFFLSNSNLLRLHGNPADYAWGAEGLDSIITQVREQQKEKVLLSVNTLSLV